MHTSTLVRHLSCRAAGQIRCLLIVGASVLAFGCAGRQVDTDTTTTTSTSTEESSTSKDPKDLKIESLTSSLSRAQSRIEELDAKLSALSDKVEATRLAVDNVAGTKPLKTEAVGSAKTHAAAESENEKTAAKARAGDAKALASMDSAISEFNKAMALFRAGKYADAELAFNHFTERYPEHVLAGSAQFYAGESYFNMGEYKLALNEYNKVVSSFASSPRVASAMVRMAHCYEAAGNATEATRTMALARDLFEGNPSLDWPSPVRGKKSDGKHGATAPKELNAGPMEPAEASQGSEGKH